MPIRLFALLLSLSATATATQADHALLVGLRSYDARPDQAGAGQVPGLRETFAAEGYRTTALRNPDAGALARAFATLDARAARDARVVIVLAGEMAVPPGGPVLLGADAPRALTPFDAGQAGVALAPVLALLEDHPGRALLVIGRDGPPLDLDVPSGVAVLQGPTDRVVQRLEGRLFSQPFSAVGRGLDKIGHLPERVFLGASQGGADREAIFFDAARRIGTEEAYEGYLDAYPDGRFEAEARAALRDLRLTPEQRAAQAEAALGLNREERRLIQRDLTDLGYNTRGVDGIFGNGTRQAIRRWQAQRGLEATGFVSGNQVTTLRAQAEARRADRAAAEAREAEAARAADRALWASFGTRIDEGELRRYLRSYPNGLFAAEAREALAGAEREAARDADRRAWAQAQQADTIAGYRAYLRAYPDGLFRREARASLRDLLDQATAPQPQPQPQPPAASDADDRAWAEAQADGSAAAYRAYLQAYPNGRFRREAEFALGRAQQFAEAQAEEARVVQNGITRLLLERTLQELGYDVGNVDARFDGQTRSAIASFQASNGIAETGFVTRRTLVAILGDLAN
ncbi:MAG: peptidoglycan-binding domain-containing protein [Shimia sp.]